MIRLQLSPLAQKDLQEIRLYITDELQNPPAAINVLKRITKKLRSITDFPNMGAALSSIADIETDYRFLVCGNYTAFYRYDGETVYIIRILYNRRNFVKILFGDITCDEE